MNRRIFLWLSIFTVLAGGVRADEFKFPLKPDSVRFAVIGDTGTGEQPSMRQLNKYLRRARPTLSNLAIMLGDNIYGSSKPADFDKKICSALQVVHRCRREVLRVAGNHDNTNEIFYKPFNMNGESYYTYKEDGNVRFFVLNSIIWIRNQLAWFETQLQSAGKNDWKVCYFHHPSILQRSFMVRLSVCGNCWSRCSSSTALTSCSQGTNTCMSGSIPKTESTTSPRGPLDRYAPATSHALRLQTRDSIRTETFMLVEIAGGDMFFQTISRTGDTVDAGVVHRNNR